jgi:hypothetical protein
MHKADKPYVVGYLSDAHILPREHGAKLYLAAADADTPTLGHVDNTFVAGVLGLFWIEERPD